jgi:hypothetical protein
MELVRLQGTNISYLVNSVELLSGQPIQLLLLRLLLVLIIYSCNAAGCSDLKTSRSSTNQRLNQRLFVNVAQELSSSKYHCFSRWNWFSCRDQILLICGQHKMELSPVASQTQLPPRQLQQVLIDH